ncbi:hypothetical protein [Nonomuraea endophytica]|uniref:Uncharacterized protein n=1 Tax=Nonomuraea endophytica TaxID=714136 RepID=A0A7W8EHJ7_9ACTN|nr:hypothetical protein [Nonomuraea endophytica]MBB5079511.1 hypothetical protein [Nonomuraea endophytica]
MIATSMSVAGLAVRLILVVTLLWGGLLSAMSAFPGSAPLSDFHRDLRSGQVDVIVADVSRVKNPASGKIAALRSMATSLRSPFIPRRCRLPPQPARNWVSQPGASGVPGAAQP